LPLNRFIALNAGSRLVLLIGQPILELLLLLEMLLLLLLLLSLVLILVRRLLLCPVVVAAAAAAAGYTIICKAFLYQRDFNYRLLLL